MEFIIHGGLTPIRWQALPIVVYKVNWDAATDGAWCYNKGSSRRGDSENLELVAAEALNML